MKTTVSGALCLALSAASFSALAVFAPAQAQRQGAPIVYAGQTPHQPSPDLALLDKPVQSAPANLTANRRVQFQYPGQTLSAAVQAPVTAAPAIAASAPTGMILKPVTTTAMAAPAATSLASGAVGLASNVVKAPAKPIRIASVQTQKPAATGKPLTLSRVNVNRDATMSEERGLAGIYMDGFEGQPTANGEIFDETAMSAAHPSLPLPSLVQVINEDNGREVVVRVNDRGPFDGKRILEVSPRAGTVLGMSQGASANVRVRYLGPAPVKQVEDGFAATKVEDDVLPPIAAPTVLAGAATTPVSAPDVEPSLPVAEYSNPGPAPVLTPQVNTVRVASPIAANNVFIQAGAFSDISNAQRLTNALGRGHSVEIEEARVNGGDFFRVLIGPFPDRAAAELYRAQLSNAGIVDGFLTQR